MCCYSLSSVPRNVQDRKMNLIQKDNKKVYVTRECYNAPESIFYKTHHSEGHSEGIEKYMA